jgi:hypothetical protein
MQMRWNQHKRHGTKSAISLKYRLPAVATAATIHANHSDKRRISASIDTRGETTPYTMAYDSPPINAMSASKDVKSSTVLTSIIVSMPA